MQHLEGGGKGGRGKHKGKVVPVNNIKAYIYIYIWNKEWIFRKWDVGVWTGLSWLRIGTGGGHLHRG
jgi:hypothetical protein